MPAQAHAFDPDWGSVLFLAGLVVVAAGLVYFFRQKAGLKGLITLVAGICLLSLGMAPAWRPIRCVEPVHSLARRGRGEEDRRRIHAFLTRPDVQREMASMVDCPELWTRHARIAFRSDPPEILLVGEALPYAQFEQYWRRDQMRWLVESYAMVAFVKLLMSEGETEENSELALDLLREARRMIGRSCFWAPDLRARIRQTRDELLGPQESPVQILGDRW